jgi:hypothetical protein
VRHFFISFGEGTILVPQFGQRSSVETLVSGHREKDYSDPSLSFNVGGLESWLSTMLNAGEISDAVAGICIYECGYNARCDARNCTRVAVTVARSIDKIGRPLKQYDLCATHTEFVVRREVQRGREVRDWRASGLS